MLPFRLPTLGSNLADRPRIAIPIGILIRKTHDQSTHAVIIPPRKTLAVPPAGAEAPHIPIALFISDLLLPNRLITNESAEGAISAAPIPWRALAAISTIPDDAKPAIIDPTVRVTKPIMKIFLCPKISDNLPPRSSRAPKTITYALNIHCKSA